MQWLEAADVIVKGMEGVIAAKTVACDLECLMDGANLLIFECLLMWCQN